MVATQSVSNMKPLTRRQLKPESRTTPAATLKQNTVNAANQAATAVKETSYRIPFLTQHGVEYFDIVDPCTLLASNDDPRVEEQIGIEGLDWSNVDPSLLANCTSMPSSAPSYFGDGTSITCPNTPSTVGKEVVVTYVYKVETANAASSSLFLPKLEREILEQLVDKCNSEGYSLVSIKSTPDDVETTGRCTVDSSSADDCYVIDGALTIEIDESSDSAVAEEAIREGIITAMDNNDLLDPTTMPEVVDVQYLDKTYNDFLKNSTVKSITCDASDLFIVSSNSTVDTSEVLVVYVYEVETANVSSTDTFLPILEENILMQLGEKCEMLGMYGVMSMHSIPYDVEMKTGPCSIESSSADNCFIIEGGLTLDVVSSFNSTWAEDQTHSIIKGSMDNDDLLNSTTIPEVVKVRYLANETFDDYMGGFTSQDGGIIVVDAEKEKSNIGAIIGSLVGAVCLILLALLFVQQRRKRRQLREAEEESRRRKQAIMAKEMELDLDDDLDDLVADIESSTAMRSANTDGHFHLGNHHYTADGVRYWSPTCALCVAAKASGALDRAENDIGNGEDERDFDELSYDLNATKKFTDFNIHDLGKHHSSMHVRECKSKTCQGCKDDLTGVVFIQSKRPENKSIIQNKSIML